MSRYAAPELLLLTHVRLSLDAGRDATDRWARARAASIEPRGDEISLYRADEGDALLEMRRLGSFAELGPIGSGEGAWPAVADARELLGADVRRQVLGLVEEVKPRAAAVPRARGLQLRHIEVPPRVMEEYLGWRERTIFEHVRARPEIDAFVAYHSVLSTEPGVLFVAEYSCDKADYLAGFSSPAYRAIVEQAGRRYIAGGERALYTTEWTRVLPAGGAEP